jgi:hypothetical protein
MIMIMIMDKVKVKVKVKETVSGEPCLIQILGSVQQARLGLCFFVHKVPPMLSSTDD